MLKTLVERKLAKYKESGCTCCPFCGSEDLTYKDVDMDSGFIHQEVRCQACNKNWEDVFELREIRYDAVEEPKAEAHKEVTRYVRGGSYFNIAGALRISHRLNSNKGWSNGLPPICFIFNGGFRVVRRVKSV